MTDFTRPRPLSEWTEEDGEVLWWKFPVDEPPFVGSPRILGQVVEIRTHQGVIAKGLVGGWPGYHTHWTPIPIPAEPQDAP